LEDEIMPFGRHFESRRGPLGDLQREIEGLFNSMMPRLGRGLVGRAFPPTNVYEDKDAMVVECELPGVSEESLDLTVTGDVLTLKGQRPALEPQENTKVHIQERGYGTFNRAITLPTTIEGDKVEARYDSGVLSIRLPKAPEAKPKQVQVSTD
jgi:HSP20 family protein